MALEIPMKKLLFSIATLALIFNSSIAANPDNQTTPPANESVPATQPAAKSPEEPIADDEINWFDWSKMTGNWGGARTELANHGVQLDVRLIQFYQGVASGGANTNFAYGGKLDYLIKLDGKKMGLWDGLFVNIHAETQFGESITDDAGGMSLPNTAMLYPLPDYHGTAITGLLVEQALNKNFVLFGGKINVIDLWTMIYPRTGGGIDGFMNTNMLAAALPWFRYVNLSFLGGGALVLRDDGQIRGGVLVFDTNNCTTTSGIPQLFDSGAGFMGLWRLFFDIDDKPGRLLFVFGGTTRTYASLSASDWKLDVVDKTISAGKKTGAWTAAVYYDQVLWENPSDKKQNVWFFTGVSISDGNPSFAKWGGFASVEGTGLIPDREKDKAGVGVFYNQLSSELKDLAFDADHKLQDIWGMEAYYNIEIAPWFHLTPNLQVIQNQYRGDDPAVIVGIRSVIDF
jgi:porin